MTPEERDAILALTLLPNGTRRLNLAGFVRVTGIDDPQSWALTQLEQGIEHKNSYDVELALLVGAAFGMDERWVVPLANVLEAGWTVSHEDAAYALGHLKDPRAVPALVRAANWLPEYLDFDESRALAVKAIHALGQIPGPEVETALNQLLEHEDHTLRPRVARVLDGRHSRRD